MIEPLPNVIGYPLERAAKMLAAAGVKVADVHRIGPAVDDDHAHRRFMVIRQRTTDSGAVELTAAAEWRTPVEASEQ